MRRVSLKSGRSGCFLIDGRPSTDGLTTRRTERLASRRISPGVSE